MLLAGDYHLQYHTLEFILRDLTVEEKKLVDVDAECEWTMSDVLKAVDAKHPSYWKNRLVILQSGLNDLHDLGLTRPWNDLFDDMKYVVNLTQANGGHVTVWAIIPWRSGVEVVKSYNEELEKYCRENDVGLLKDTEAHEWTDGFHLRRRLYEVWADRTMVVIRNYLGGSDNGTVIREA